VASDDVSVASLLDVLDEEVGEVFGEALLSRVRIAQYYPVA
jgi:hypothetical protein